MEKSNFFIKEGEITVNDVINNLKSFDEEQLSRLYAAVFNQCGLYEKESDEFTIIANDDDDIKKLQIIKDLFDNYDSEGLQDMIDFYNENG